MARKSLVLAALTVVSLAATGCSKSITMGSEVEQGPVGTGKTIKELKKTPCACTEIPMNISMMYAI